jgi:uncharacterized protein YfaS (alpha-2-macroglobulin family)
MPKHSLRYRMLIAFLFFFSLGNIVAMAQLTRDERWPKVQEAMGQGLPQTAIGVLQEIQTAAEARGATAEAIRAHCQRLTLETQIQGGGAENAIRALQRDIPKAPLASQPILKTILAHWYWGYYQQNRWRFANRTQTQQAPSDDFETWDLKRLLQEADKLFDEALADPIALQKVPVGDYDALLDKGSVPDSYRPTLFDFLAFEAIEFYRLAEQGTRPEGDFVLAADSAILGDWDDFLKWEIPSPESPSATVKGLKLLQNLAKFHAQDQDPSARLDIDLTRLGFGYDESSGEEKSARFKAGLRRFMERHRDHESFSRAAAMLAGRISAEGDLVEARKVAREGAAAHRDSMGAILCQNLIHEIEAPSGQVTTERVWSPSQTRMDVSYKNVRKVYFRLIRIDAEERLRAGKYAPGQAPWQDRDAIRAQKPIRAWEAELAPTPDSKRRVVSLPIPEDLPFGPHYLIASFNPEFSDQGNAISVAEVNISRLAIVLRTNYGDGYLAGMVLENESGRPIEGADVIAWVPVAQRSEPTFRALPVVKTDAKGIFQIQAQENLQHILQVRKGSDHLFADEQVWQERTDSSPTPFQRTFLFTDRAIYRPGQTISFKGVCLQADQAEAKYQTIPRTNVRIALRDMNGEEVESQALTTNERGSFHGSFTAPTGRGTGSFTLSMTMGPGGQQNVQIEEYKRPKFFVTLEKPKSAPRLRSEVMVSGKASAYSTAPIDGAAVRYRVVREVRYPDWWYYRCWWWPRDHASQEIVHGTTKTDSQGAFQVTFVALPDEKVPQESEPVFTYSVYADVVDTTGETRSASQSVRVGYTALEATVTADEWQTPSKAIVWTLRTMTLDGEGQKGSGTLKVYRLREPKEVRRAELPGSSPWHWDYLRETQPDSADAEPDWANESTWPNGDLVVDKGFETNADGVAELEESLPVGVYRARVDSQDRYGKEVHGEKIIRVLDLDATKFPIKIADSLSAPAWSVEPGSDFIAVWGTGYDRGQAYIEVVHLGKVLQEFWTDLKRNQQTIRVPVTEKMRGGFMLRITHVQENRSYLHVRHIDVPWSNKNLAIRWERFRSKLEPGSKETWTAVVTGPDAKLAAAEMVAAMYDASLDAFLAHNWVSGFDIFAQDHRTCSLQFQNREAPLHMMWNGWPSASRGVSWTYRHFPYDLGFGGGFAGGDIYLGLKLEMDGTHADRMGGMGGMHLFSKSRARGGREGPEMMMDAAAAPMAEGRAMNEDKLGEGRQGSALREEVPGSRAQGDSSASSTVSLDAVTARKNLQETAFFFPSLLIEKEGKVEIQFTMPEALTEWKFLGFAHDTEARAGLLSDKIVSSKDLMVQPNPPRFLREGDLLEFTVKVANKAPKKLAGKVRLTFSDAATGDSYDAQLQNGSNEQSFELDEGRSESFSWRLKVPDGARVLTYKAVAASEKVSDGEEGFLPILSRRVLVTEAMPLPIRGKQERKFNFDRLRDAGNSKTLQHQSLTVQVTSNPAWYAVMALPYLMDFPYECNEQTFNRLYANALAEHIANSQPRIRQIFEQWRGTETLDSPLLKNQDIKGILIEETPWLREAKQESEARRNVGLLFDANRMQQELKQAGDKLRNSQFEDGTWSWFPGGRPNEFITLYIVTGFGRLRHLGVETDVQMAIKALPQLDRWMSLQYEEIKKRGTLNNNHLSSLVCFYLYGRSFFAEEVAIAPEHQEAFQFYLAQGKKHWVSLGDRLSQGHLAIALKRWGDQNTPKDIVKSLRERSLLEDEMGMFWREGEASWWWYRAPIETQALMIEVFDEVAADAKSVEELKIWLIKQKQTQDWKTTKATADAVYGLLLRGEEMLSASGLVEVTLGELKIEPDKVEAGTGYYTKKIDAGKIQPQLADILVKNPNPGVAWGSVHWQYFEDMQNITAQPGNPLKVSKKLFVKENTPQGPTLVAVDGQVAVGDELVTRVEVRVDRAMEYVHLKDYRGSGTEPVDVLSQYRYQDGLAYYQSTRDTASHFFIDYLPRGTYVFEYSTRVQHKGEYQTGYALIECMYAPEFGSHSESIPLNVK